MASRDIKLSKCGIRFNPPAIILTYIKDGKSRRRTMPLRNFNKNSGVKRVAEDLRSNSRHQPYLESLTQNQLEKLLTMIRDKLNGASKEAVIAKANKVETVIDPEEDLNKADDLTLSLKKAVMEKTFEMNRKRPDDPDFQYEVEVEFQTGPLETCDWDSDDDNGF